MKRFWKTGDPFIWLTGGGLSLCLLMTGGLLLLILVHGLGFCWPADVVELTLADGSIVLGQQVDREEIPQPDAAAGTPTRWRIKIKQGNRDLLPSDFVWVDESAIASRRTPAEVLMIERMEWGNLYGTATALRRGEVEIATGSEATVHELAARLRTVQEINDRIRQVEHDDIAPIHRAQETARLALRRLELAGIVTGAEPAALQQAIADAESRYAGAAAHLADLRAERTDALVVATASGARKELMLHQIVRWVQPNAMSVFDKLWFYLGKVAEFILEDPRESNTEGGIFPAIFGTVMMVILMSLVATPLGVLAALFLREYARQGPVVSAVRIAVNNLAGVPSIVFGVFGVGFFVYFIGGSIDEVFYRESLPAPTYGTGGILWASLTLALLTVPVVIVATEEGLAAIPAGMREASLALGATKFETTWRVVLPSVMPSILTGMILAVARAAGEVAPLMLTGVVKLAPTLPLDGEWPFFHLDRKFMHLGFHIYDVGFQSPNVDAAQPMVYATTLLLLFIVLVLNLTAVMLRRRLRARYAASVL